MKGHRHAPVGRATHYDSRQPPRAQAPLRAQTARGSRQALRGRSASPTRPADRQTTFPSRRCRTLHFREWRRVPRLAEAAAARSGPGSAARRLPGARRAEPPGVGGRGRRDRGGLRTIGAMLNMWKVRELVDKA